jgi:hypothetical protein
MHRMPWLRAYAAKAVVTLRYIAEHYPQRDYLRDAIR